MNARDGQRCPFPVQERPDDMIHRKTRHTRDEANDPSVRLRTEGRPSGSSASTAGV